MSDERRIAVCDLGSNSFRLVVFTVASEGWSRRTDEIHEAVRIGAGLAETGRLSEEGIARALATTEVSRTSARPSGSPRSTR